MKNLYFTALILVVSGAVASGGVAAGASGAAPPQLFALDPDVGRPGTLVGMAGRGFRNVSTAGCRFGSVNASFAYYTGERRVYCTAPRPAADEQLLASMAARAAQPQLDNGRRLGAAGSGHAPAASPPAGRRGAAGAAQRVDVACTNDGVAYSRPQTFTYIVT